MKEGAKEFNKLQSKKGFTSISIRIKGKKPKKVIIPIPAKDIFEQKIHCEECSSRYSLIGSAFFCPRCGHNSVERSFSNIINKIESSIDNIPKIREAINEISKDQAQDTCQTIIEKGLLDCVVAFQSYCELMYKKHSKAKSKIPFNAFQKLDVGEELWREVFNISYSEWLNKTKYKRLNIFFQRRHLLQHTNGIVDQKYIEKSFDSKYKVGQRIVVKEKDVKELVSYIKILTSNIRENIKAV